MGQILYMVVIFAIMFGFMYIFLILPDKKRRKKYSEMLEGLKVNDMVTSKGGIMGRVVNIQDDYIVLESGPDRARIKMLKTGIFTIDNAQEIQENK